MGFDFKRFVKGLNLVPQDSDNTSEAGDLQAESSDGKLLYHDGNNSSPLVTESGTATLTNKTLTDPIINGGSIAPTSITILDTALTIEDNGDTTKHLKFNASGITTGTTRTLSSPDADTTIVGTDATQTLTNKTLTGNKADTLLSNSGTATITLPTSTSNLATLALTETLTNKTLTGNKADNLLSNSGAATITLPTTTSTLATLALTETLTNKTLTGNKADTLLSNSGTATITLPTSTSNLATLALSETLSNKTLTAPIINIENMTEQGSTPANPSAGTLKVYAKTDDNLYTLNSTGVESQLTTAASVIPTGVTLPYGGSSAPSGWLLCDGSAISRTVFSALFGVIGTSFGAGNGTTTFNIPLMARNTPVGAGGSGTATLGNTVGSTGGAEAVTLTAAESGVPAHTHTGANFADINHKHFSGMGIKSDNTECDFRTNGSNTPIYGSQTVSSSVRAITSSGEFGSVTIKEGKVSTPTDLSTVSTAANTTAPASSAHNNLQPSVVFNYIIKT